jgi:hypothetical protein
MPRHSGGRNRRMLSLMCGRVSPPLCIDKSIARFIDSGTSRSGAEGYHLHGPWTWGHKPGQESICLSRSDATTSQTVKHVIKFPANVTLPLPLLKEIERTEFSGTVTADQSPTGPWSAEIVSPTSPISCDFTRRVEPIERRVAPLNALAAVGPGLWASFLCTAGRVVWAPTNNWAESNPCS